MNIMLVEHLTFLWIDEIFDILNDCYERFQNYIFKQNFLIVVENCNKINISRKNYHCSHKDNKTLNIKKFDEYVKIAKTLTNRRQKLIKINVMKREWNIFLNFKRFKKNWIKVVNLNVNNKVKSFEIYIFVENQLFILWNLLFSLINIYSNLLNN